MTDVPSVYDSWGPLTRENIVMIMATGGAVYPPYDRASDGNVVFPNICHLISPVSGVLITIQAGSYLVNAFGALVVKVPPSVANGAVVTPEVVDWVGVERTYQNRDWLVLGVRDGYSGIFNWRIPPPNDKWHDFGASGEPAFANGWTAYGPPFMPPGFMRDKNRTFLRGLLLSPVGWTVGTSTPLMAALPLGYRPPASALMAVLSSSVIARIDADVAGLLYTTYGLAGSTFWQLDNLSFPTV